MNHVRHLCINCFDYVEECGHTDKPNMHRDRPRNPSDKPVFNSVAKVSDHGYPVVPCNKMTVTFEVSNRRRKLLLLRK